MIRNCLLILLVLVVCSSFHPLHLTITNLEYLSDEKQWVVSTKLFTDDFHEVLLTQYGKQALGDDSTITIKDEQNLLRYFKTHMRVSINSIPIPVTDWNLHRVHANDEATWVEYRFIFEKEPTEFSIKNTLLFDLFNDQKNLLFVGWEEKEKAFQFTQKKGFFTFRF